MREPRSNSSTRARALVSFVVATLAVGACASSEEAQATGAHWTVDCVAITGSLQITALTPLERVPFSGLSRERLIGSFSDEELSHFCDYVRCGEDNGYNYVCVPAGKEAFRLEADPILSEDAITCYRTPAHYVGEYFVWSSEEECVDIYRRYFSQCHLGLVEDCLREQAVRPLTSLGYLPACDAQDRECGG